MLIAMSHSRLLACLSLCLPFALAAGAEQGEAKKPNKIERAANKTGKGVEPRALKPEAFEKLIQDDYEAMARVVKAVGRVE